jgi:hypothetical protein
VAGVAVPNRSPAAGETASPVTVFDQTARARGHTVPIMPMPTLPAVPVSLVGRVALIALVGLPGVRGRGRSAPESLHVGKSVPDALACLGDELGEPLVPFGHTMPRALIGRALIGDRGQPIACGLGDETTKPLLLGYVTSGELFGQRGELVASGVGDGVGDRVIDSGPAVLRGVGGAGGPARPDPGG